MSLLGGLCGASWFDIVLLFFDGGIQLFFLQMNRHLSFVNTGTFEMVAA